MDIKRNYFCGKYPLENGSLSAFEFHWCKDFWDLGWSTQLNCRSGELPRRSRNYFNYEMASCHAHAHDTHPHRCSCRTLIVAHTPSNPSHTLPLSHPNWQADRWGQGFGRTLVFPNAAEYQKYSDKRSASPVNCCHFVLLSCSTLLFQKRRTIRHS